MSDQSIHTFRMFLVRLAIVVRVKTHRNIVNFLNAMLHLENNYRWFTSDKVFLLKIMEVSEHIFQEPLFKANYSNLVSLRNQNNISIIPKVIYLYFTQVGHINTISRSPKVYHEHVIIFLVLRTIDLFLILV